MVTALAEAQFGGERLRGLPDACRAFDIPPPPTRRGERLEDRVEAAVKEVRTLAALHGLLIEEHRRRMPQRPPSGAISAGSYTSALLEWAGLRPRLELQPDFPRDILAAAMAATFGGEVFVQVRAPNIPAYSLDVGGLYAVAGIHCRAWDLYTARSIQVRERDPAATATYVENLVKRIA
ncbi:MAG: hypothetical protein FJ313_05745, partial [Gemmatimonadetes bacterium]|nr:hypothetical protein [Gemmatimonadota bacterium]